MTPVSQVRKCTQEAVAASPGPPACASAWSGAQRGETPLHRPQGLCSRPTPCPGRALVSGAFQSFPTGPGVSGLTGACRRLPKFLHSTQAGLRGGQGVNPH